MADTRITCGTCGQKTRHIGSHVLAVHVPYFSGQNEKAEALRAERNARAERDNWPYCPRHDTFERPSAFVAEVVGAFNARKADPR